MTSRRVVLASGAALAAAVGVFGATRLDPRPLPAPQDTSLLRSVIADQNRVLAIALADPEHAAIATLLAAQVSELGGSPTTTPREGELLTELRDAARHRAQDARAARSPEFAMVLASCSAGLTQATLAVRSAA